jgi:hypothetical protein
MAPVLVHAQEARKLKFGIAELGFLKPVALYLGKSELGSRQNYEFVRDSASFVHWIIITLVTCCGELESTRIVEHLSKHLSRVLVYS